MNDQLNTKQPTAIIVHGANFLGEKLAEILSSQKTNIIVIDEFTRKTKKTLQDLKSKHKAKIYDLSGVPGLSTEIKRVDYIFILLDQYLVTTENLSSKKFLSETNSIDALFKIALKQSAKVTLTTTISGHRKLSTIKPQDTDKLSSDRSQNPYTPMELQRYAENLAAEYHDNAALNIRICRLGEVIGKGMPLDSNTTFVDMIKESITKPRITITGEGLDFSYYINSLDAVYGLIKATFSGKTNGEVFSLSYPEEISTLSLAYRTLEMNPKAGEIVFTESSGDEGPPQIYVPAKNLTKIGWNPRISFEESLMESIQYFYDEYNLKWEDKPSQKDLTDKQESLKAKAPRSERVTTVGKIISSVTSPFSRLKEVITSTLSSSKTQKVSLGQVFKWVGISLAVVAVYFLLIAPIIQILLGASLGYYFGNKGYKQAYSLDTDAAQKSLERSSYFTSLANTGFQNLRWVSYVPGVKNLYQNTSNIADGAEHLSKAGNYLVKGFDPYAEYFNNFEPITTFDQNTGGGSREYLNELRSMEDGVQYIESASIEISLATESLNDVDTSIYPASIRNYIKKLKDTTAKLDETIGTVNEFSSYMPEILGEDDRKTYIVLFQNPMELRSTGGWLTSYAVIGIEHGQIRTMTVDDVYNADGQLTEKVDPPESMQKALGTKEWNLSLSNWSPDFPESAEAAEYFLKLEDKVVNVDGVIAIDLQYVSELIDIWGEIKVPGESDPVTKDNIYDKVIEIHKEFTPGSTNKPVFLSNLANEILKKLLSDGKSKISEVSKVTTEALDENHIQIYMHNSQVAEVLDNLGWSGHLEPKTNIIYPVEWNYGGNKANYYIDRSTTVATNIIDENTIQQKLTINYENSSTQNIYPEGDYECFIRIFLPQGVTLVRVEGIESYTVKESSSFQLETLSGHIVVPTKGQHSISVTYRLEREDMTDFPLEIGPGSKLTYRLNFIKQAGLDADPITIQVSYPDLWEPTDLSDIQREINTLVKRTNLEKDEDLVLTWEK
ncbi:DUF4012 domain-containing protein [Candidatus Dojkabacteria bacterium]|nr:DUF4012 domain-containing protein [Candidatus Dojkabacteria bacterium]